MHAFDLAYPIRDGDSVVTGDHLVPAMLPAEPPNQLDVFADMADRPLAQMNVESEKG